jgi:hypothetical protein
LPSTRYLIRHIAQTAQWSDGGFAGASGGIRIVEHRRQPVGDHNRCTFLGEQLGFRRPHTVCATSNDCDFVFSVLCDSPLSMSTARLPVAIADLDH